TRGACAACQEALRMPYTSRRLVLRTGAGLSAGGASALAAACGAAGQGSSPESVNPTGQVVKVTFFSPANDPGGEEIMKDQTRQFNEKNKNVQIDYVYTATDDNYKQYTT